MSLIVYKSSAGSGKTATLVLEYLRLCLPDPMEFKRTLAITFTNKAANEMKSRIISTLKIGVKGDTNFIISQLKSDLNFDNERIQLASQKLLSLIIHNYDEFAVSTIDSFVHRVIRTFTNEVNLPTNFEVILDKDDIIPEIVDELFDKVGKDSELTQIMVSFVMKQIEEEKSHDLGRILSEFVEYNFSEDVFKQKEFLQNLNLRDFPPLIKRLFKKQHIIKAEIEKYAKKAIDLFDLVSLEADDLSQKKRGVFGYFENLLELRDDKKLIPNSYALKAVEQDVWVAAKASNEIKSAIDHIKEELKVLFHSIQEIARDYFLIKLINSRIYSVALTAEIQMLFEEFIERTSKVHISEFNKRISENIADQPIPFLYERLGFKYKHFLIDEFQDTSVLQWDNLLPLIEESLANNNFNMLVGDAKQAIYRFRNGEVQLFTNLPKMFGSNDSLLNRNRENLFTSQFEERFLDVNYRSNKQIVEFNNDFFGFLRQQESERYKKNYTKLEQKVHNKHDAYVRLELVDADTASDYSTKRLEVIEGFLIDTINNGFSYGDICILCRTKKQLAELASYLVSKKHSIVSSESLLVSNSPKVSLIISFLRLLLSPDMKIQFADFVLKYAGLRGIEEAEELFHEHVKKETKYSPVAIHLMAINENVDDLLSYSVYEISEFVIRAMGFDKTADAFIQYFLDFIYRMQLAGRYTLKEFLDSWDEKKSKVFVEMPEDNNAIKLMTAHKSKGLDFKVVIADMYYSRKNSPKNFWTNIDVGEEILSRTMLPLQKDLSLVGKQDIYDEEQEKDRLDFLNLVYVVFTRASEALFAVGKSSNSKGKVGKDIFGSLLENYIRKVGQDGEEEKSYVVGSLVSSKVDESEDDTENKEELDKMISTNWHSIIKIADSEDVFWEAHDLSKPASFGKLVHKILSEVNYQNDVKKSVAKYRMSGLIDRDEESKIESMINDVVMHPTIKKYYADKAIVKNETELIDKEGKIFRPDRIVLLDDELAIIDYKTGSRDKKHKHQINGYATVFKDLGFEHITSYLVYVGNELIVERIENVR